MVASSTQIEACRHFYRRKPHLSLFMYVSSPTLQRIVYRVVQLNLTPEIEVLFICCLIDIVRAFGMTSLIQHMEYLNFWC